VNARKISENELWDYYYDAMELIDSSNLPEAEKLLGKALVLDPGFVAAHVGMVALYQAAGYDEGVRKFTESSYLETTKRFRKWPDDLTWGISENRQYLRAMCYKATQHQVDGENEEAEKLYCLLLKCTPHDNQGVRYLLAGMYAGISPNEVDAMFDEGNEKQDWSALEHMLNEQNTKQHFWKPPKL
jgi:tetratricopeptide (TPR) repeat protein